MGTMNYSDIQDAIKDLSNDEIFLLQDSIRFEIESRGIERPIERLPHIPRTSPFSIGLRVGDRVQFNSHARPHYIQGELATITALNRKRVTINLDRPVGRFGQNNIRCPITIIDKI